ncbi:flagellar brake protein [Ruminiclostridium herbifermentans]|uniref:Flagellar brake protein n=1 Tax=Ruminiclostridium herbifermentans TaxID=2488810 RepID=A0A4U7JBZ1_9FIRM|nr:PilZ domain-containing protein [Ruminiclostridium herbifermentans]QNU65854.1 flagellar brake protein [Ruminiclostridium herbifermentans]
MDTNKLEVGTKLEIKIPHTTSSDSSDTYSSQLIDIIDNKTVSIAAPISDGTFKYLNIGLDLFVYFLDENKDFLFFSAIVKGHRKNGPVEAFDITIVSEIKKVQRREAYRLETALICKYAIVDSELINSDSPNFPDINNAVFWDTSTTNISSNGISLHLDAPLEAGTILYIIVNLDKNSKIRVLAQVKRSLRKDGNKYMVGMHFIKIHSRDLEVLTKFIFAQQRVMLKNKMPLKFR